MTIQARWTAGTAPGANIIRFKPEQGFELLGNGGFATPQSLFNASLATSAVLRMARYGRRARLEIQSLQAEVSLTRMPAGVVLTMAICIAGRLSGRQRQALLRAAELCPISKVVCGKISVITLEGTPDVPA